MRQGDKIIFESILRRQKYVTKWIFKVEIENHIEEKVGEIPAEQIDEIVFTKDQKTVNDKKERISQIQEIGYEKIECEDFNEAFQNLEI